VNDPRSPEPRTAAGKLLLRQFPGPHMDSLILAIEAEASSSDELRAALAPDEWEYIAQLVDAFAADDPTGLPNKLRAALSSKPSAK
jgi:hypothetical protein